MASSRGGGFLFSNKNWEGGGGYNFYLKIFWEGSVLKHYTFLKTTAPPWDVINDRSLNVNRECFVVSISCLQSKIVWFNTSTVSANCLLESIPKSQSNDKLSFYYIPCCCFG